MTPVGPTMSMLAFPEGERARISAILTRPVAVAVAVALASGPLIGGFIV